MAVHNGHLYAMGGTPWSGLVDTVYHATINPDTGAVGAWTLTTPLPTARYMHSSAVYNGYLYAIGGADAGGNPANGCWAAVINADGTLGTWNAVTLLPAARAQHQSVAHNGKMYVIGGRTASGSQNDVLVADIRADGQLGAWSSLTSFATARVAHAALAAGGYMFVLGGETTYTSASYLNDVQMARINADGTLGAWSGTTSFAAARGYLTSVTEGGFLYVLGGCTVGQMGGSGSTYASDVQFTPLNPSGASSVVRSRINADGTLAGWTQTTPLPAYWAHMGLAAYNGYMYVVRGATGGNETDRVLFAPINTDGSLGAWADTTAITNTTRDYNAAVALNGRLYVIGGEDGGQAWNEVWSAPIQANGTLGAWTAEPPMTTGRWTPAVVAVNDALYVFGGYSGGDLSSTEWRRPASSGGGYVYVYEDASASYAFKVRLRIPASAYRDTSGETRPATGNLSGTGDTGGREIVVAGGRGSEGRCYIFGDAAEGHRWLWSYQGGWPAYWTANGELWPACGDVVGTSEDEILLGVGRGGAGWLRVRSVTVGANRYLQVPWGAYNSLVGEARPAAGDIDADGKAEIAIGLGRYPTAGGNIYLFDDGLAGYASLGRKPAGWTTYNTANGETRPSMGNMR